MVLAASVLLGGLLGAGLALACEINVRRWLQASRNSTHHFAPDEHGDDLGVDATGLGKLGYDLGNQAAMTANVHPWA